MIPRLPVPRSNPVCFLPDSMLTEKLLSQNLSFPKPYRTDAEWLGANVQTEIHSDGSATASILPCEELYGQKIMVPGDISSAAYFIAAALLVPGSEILIKM